MSPLPSPSHATQTAPAYLMATLGCGLTTLLTQPLSTALDPVNTVMLYLLTVVLVARWLGRGPAVLASFLSVALFDFFHVAPRLSFAVSDVQYLLTFAVMLTVALLIGHLTTGLKQRATEAQHMAARAQALSSLARTLAGALTVEQVCEASTAFVHTHLQADLVLLRPVDKSLAPSAGQLQAMGEPRQTLSPTALLAAHTVHIDHKGLSTSQMGGHDEAMVMLPMQGATRSRGVLVVVGHEGQGQALQAQRPLIEGLASLVATSLERLHFVDVAHRTQIDIASERLRSSILSALSHDIRTPLTALYGLADSLTLSQPPLAAQPAEMALAIRDQAMRLHRMVTNLLDMARLQSGQEAGHLKLRQEWQPIEEVIGASIQTLGSALQRHPVRVHMPADLPLLSIDAVLMERVFGNLLENASKYAPLDTDIHLHASREGPCLLVRVCNAGAGFPPHKLQDVFELFERGSTESSVPGIGLGLAICRAIVQAHEGHIEALNPPEGGAEVRFTLPLGTPPVIVPEATP